MSQETAFEERYKELGFDPVTVRKHWSALNLLMNKDESIPSIRINWTYADVRDQHRNSTHLRMISEAELTDQQCFNILDSVWKCHDSDVGVTWDVLEVWIERELKVTKEE